MGKRYSVATSVAVTNTDAKVLFNAPCQPAAAVTRAWVYDILVGSKSAPADNAGGYKFMRSTTAGTTPTTTYTPNALDPGNPAGSCIANAGTYATDPTTTANSQLLTLAHNQRMPVRWCVNCGSGCEFVIPATNNNGFANVGYVPSTAFGIDYTVMWEE